MLFKILSIVLAVLLVGVGIGVYFYGQNSYNAGKELGKQEGYKACEAKLQPEINRLQTETENLKKQIAEKKLLRNPTYAELMNFLKRDKTNDRKPTSPIDTWNFAPELKRNAQKEGFQAFIVVVGCEGFTQLINAFMTTDQGLIYIEPQNDKPVKVNIGESYFTQNSWSKPKDKKDTIIAVSQLL